MRLDILDAAMSVFTRTGIHSTTIEMIAREAGLGKGTIYLYFKSKEELTIRLLENIFAGMEERLEATPAPETLDDFLAQLHASLDIPQEQASFIRIFFEVFGPEFRSEEFATSVAVYFDRLGKRWGAQISILQERGEIRAEINAELTARTMVSMIDGIVLHKGLFAICNTRYKLMVNEALCLVGNGLRV